MNEWLELNSVERILIFKFVKSFGLRASVVCSSVLAIVCTGIKKVFQHKKVKQKKSFYEKISTLRSQINTFEVCCCSAWPDLAKLSHFGKSLKVFGNYLRMYLVFGQFFGLFGKSLMVLGNFSLLIMAKYWKFYLSIWSHCCCYTFQEGSDLNCTTTNTK